MTARERVLAALRFEETDRPPIDFGGHRSSGIAALAYARLKAALGIRRGGVYVYDMIQQLAVVEPEVLDVIGGDTVELGRAFLTEDSDWKEWVLPDGTPCRVPAYLNLEKRGDDWLLLAADGTPLAVQKPGCLYFEQIHWPWLDRRIDEQDFADLEDAFAHSMWTAVASPGGHLALDGPGRKALGAGARALRERSGRAVIGLFGGNLFEVPQFLYRTDNYLMHLALHPDACERLSEALFRFHLPRLEAWLGAVAPYIDVMLFGDDLGGQNGPMISPAMYRRFFKPWHRRMWRRVKELAPHVNVHLHSCGGIEPLLDDLIDAGLESCNPVQISCRGMDAAHLKETYGERLVLWGGGCDTREVLPYGTPQEIRRHVRGQIDVMAPGGGFVFQQVHNVLADVPAENVLAMFAAVRER